MVVGVSALRALTVVSLIGMGISAAGCGMTKNLDEMHNSTGEMAVTTKQMNEKMDQLAQMNQQMGTMNGQMTKMVDTMTQMASIMGQMAEMNQAMQQMKGDMGTMIGTLGGMNDKMTMMPKMGESLGHIDTVMGDLNKMMASLDKKMDELPKVSKNLNSVASQIGAMQGQLTGLRKDLGTLNLMHDTLKGMSTNMGAMSTGVASMEKGMDHLNNMATGLAADAKQAVGQSLRSSSLASLLQAGQSLSTKFTNAAAYLQAFDYQNFRDDGQSDQTSEEQMRTNAVQAFFFDMKGVMHGEMEFPVVSPGPLIDPDNDMETLLVVSAALHVVYTNKLSAIKKAGGDPNAFLSMWGMIKEALNRRAEADAGKPVPEWVHEVLKNKDAAIYLAQIRANILGAIALNNLDKLPQNPDSNWNPFTWYRAAQVGSVLRDILGSWDADIKNATIDQIKDTRETLQKALDAKYFLMHLGVSPRINFALRKSLGHCDLPLGGSVSSAERDKYLKAFQAELKAYGT